MIKLLICLTSAFLLAVAMLQLRQQQTELRHRTAMLQAEIEAQQAKLWSQQLRIALATAPGAVAETVAASELHLAPAAKLPDEAGNWIIVRDVRAPRR